MGRIDFVRIEMEEREKVCEKKMGIMYVNAFVVLCSIASNSGFVHNQRWECACGVNRSVVIVRRCRWDAVLL